MKQIYCLLRKHENKKNAVMGKLKISHLFLVLEDTHLLIPTILFAVYQGNHSH